VHGVCRAVQRLDVLFGEVVGRRVGPRQHAYLPGLAGLGVRRAPGLWHGQPRRGRGRRPQRQQVARLERAPLARSAPAAHHITGMLANGLAASIPMVCTPERPEAPAPQEGCLPRPAPARPRPLAAAVGNGDERLAVQALAGRPARAAAPDPDGPGRGGGPRGPGCRPGARWGTWRARPGMRAWPGRPPRRCSTARPARAPAARRGRLRGVPRPRPPRPPSARPPQSLSGRITPKSRAHQAGCRTLSQTRLARKQTQAFGMARSSCT